MGDDNEFRVLLFTITSLELPQIFPEQGAFAMMHIDFMQCAWRSEKRWSWSDGEQER